ncbi:MAG: alkyl hydroperoxide reductase subunit F [Kofleriaceae bacterium]|nr:alkyl hydroperoxide reductase subunit F [Kofleriaceae bacterium]
MLDADLLTQLRTLFAPLEHDLTLRVRPSDHPRQAELLALAEGVASTSPRLHLEVAGVPVPTVQLELWRGGDGADLTPTDVVFRAVPGGHEFSSLVLALLHADGKGKLPDAALTARIRAVRGPLALRTYMALSCTSCPDVVQALDLIALLHPEVSHEVIDGDLAGDEVAALGLQAVPTVYLGDRVLSVGKSSLGQLLVLLEEAAGTTATADPAVAPTRYDVVVIGGGPAGASAAIYTARKGLRTALVAERLGGQLQDTLGIENLIGTRYTEGPRLAADLDQHLRAYPVEVLEHRRVERVVDGPVKQVVLSGGEVLEAGRIVIATGARWRELEVPGEKAYLGRGVAFCPHCDGPFYKGRPVAVVGGGNSGVEAALDLAGLCSHVTLIEFADELKADAVLVGKLRERANVTVITGARTTEIVGDGAKVTALRYQDRASGEVRDVPLDGVFVQIGLSPNSALARGLVELNRFGEIVVDGKGRTSVPGIYAAGDVTTEPFKQIVIAMGKGSTAALAAFEDSLRAAP